MFCSELWFDTEKATQRLLLSRWQTLIQGPSQVWSWKTEHKNKLKWKMTMQAAWESSFMSPFGGSSRSGIVLISWSDVDSPQNEKQLSSTLVRNKVSEIKCFKPCSFILMVTRAAAGNIFICNPKVTTAGRPANLFLLCSPTTVKNAPITGAGGLLGGYQLRNPVNSWENERERGHWVKIKGAEQSGDDRQECMKGRCAEVF